jgi:hypothetical protein
MCQLHNKGYWHIMTALRISHHLSQLRDARAHLECAIAQSLPGDDAIIIDHMRAASAQLLVAIREMQDERSRLLFPELGEVA